MSTVRVDGVASETAHALSLSPEVGVSLPIGPRAAVVPAVAVGVRVPYATQDAAATLELSGALGLALRVSRKTLVVLEPEAVWAADASALLFSVRLFRAP